MSNERDTKFAGFAKALWDEVLSKTPRYEEISLILARRAYDLGCHIGDELLGPAWDESCLSYVPDLPELPEEKP